MNTAQVTALPTTPQSAATHTLARLVVWATLPLILFGGSVTSLDAGMAVKGWLTVESSQGERLLWLYPLEDWFHNLGQFVEHTHRMLGTVVGLLAIGAVISAFLTGASAVARKFTGIALLAVCIQGAIGGFRVLENSPELAFLHGALGQAVFACLVAAAVVTSPRWGSASPVPMEGAADLRALATRSCVIVYTMIVSGAWLRHTNDPMALAIHLMLLMGVLGAVVVLFKKLAGVEGAGALEHLVTCGRRLSWIIKAQVILGVFAMLAVMVWYGPSANGVHDSIMPTLHVLGGALLLGQCLASRMWIGRLLSEEGSS
jgi:cytochrome c oxidase assembly protein subunit 15